MLCSLWIGSCQPNATTQSPAMNRDGKPDVVTTSTIITDWTQQIAGDRATVIGILKPGDDPHIYEPVPADSRSLEEAELILYNGYNLEPNIIKLINAAGISAHKVAVGEVIAPLQLNDRQRGVVPDPHVWGSAKNAIVMVALIRDELIRLSPSDKTTFSHNAEVLIRELERLHQWIPQQIQTIPTQQRQLVTTHDAFQYYANTYGLKVAGTLIGISTEEQPSAQTVQQLAESIRQLGVPTIFAETTINPRLITTVAEAAQVKLATPPLYSDSIGAPGSPGDTYINMMVVNTRTIVKNLGGQVTPF
ncbi:MAG: zinc ABC transporter substrate-binding protein [Cyanobacteriota bacterium SKYGB_h_bin112]|nr:zinc ABC transporter substrate-binding protein [Cyanobacteriota bacterium SKYGB_h_bin112]